MNTSVAIRRSKTLKPAEIHELFSRLAELNPHPTTELAYTTPFELLVAVILSAQATDVGVNKATRRLYPVANTAAAILALGEEGLKPYIATIGPVSYTHLDVYKRQQPGSSRTLPARPEEWMDNLRNAECGSRQQETLC